MPGLMQMLQKLKKNDDDCKILVLGLDNAGKTTILRQLGKEDLSQVRPTQGFNMQLLQHGPYTLNCARPASTRPSRAPQTNDARARRIERRQEVDEDVEEEVEVERGLDGVPDPDGAPVEAEAHGHHEGDVR
jgi:GTPase SAR1 family protein